MNPPVLEGQSEDSKRLLFALLAGDVADELVAEAANVPVTAVRVIRDAAALAVKADPRQFANLISDIGEWQEMLRRAPVLFDEPSDQPVAEDYLINEASASVEPCVRANTLARISSLEKKPENTGMPAMASVAIHIR